MKDFIEENGMKRRKFMKYLFLLMAVIAFFPVFAEEDVIGSDLENDEDITETADNEVPDFSIEEEGAGISVTTTIFDKTVVYGRVFYNYITKYSSGRIYVYDQVGETDEFALSSKIPADSEKTDFFGGYVGMSGESIFTLNAIYGEGSTHEKQLDIYKNKEGSGWTQYKTFELPEDYDVTGGGFALDSGIIVMPVYNAAINDKSYTELFVYSSSDEYETYKAVVPENFEKDLYMFNFPVGYDISGDTIVATSTSMKDEFTYGPSSIHIFTKNTETGNWTETQTIVTNDTDPEKAFYNIAISGDRFIVHSYIDDNNSVGYVLIFEKKDGTWELIKRIIPDESVTGTHFGWNISISGDFAVATDKGDSKSLPFGNTYVFYKDYDPLNPDTRAENNWGLYKKYEVTEETPLMGSVVTLEGDILSMGAAPSILKAGSPLIPYIEKLDDPVFTDSETGDIEVSDDTTDEIAQNSDADSTVSDTEETLDTEENTVTENKDSSGCSALIF